MSVDATKIKVGDKVRLRNGDVKTVTEVKHQDDYTYPVDVFWGSDEVEYTRDGFYWYDREPDHRDIVEIIPASEEKIDTNVNLDNLKVGDTIKLADGTVAVVTKIDPVPSDDELFRRQGHRYTVHFRIADGPTTYWNYRKDGTGHCLGSEQIVEIVPASEEKIDTKVNLVDLKVGDTIEFADGTTATVTDVDASDDSEHEYVVSYRTKYGVDYWYYHEDGTGATLTDEVIVAIIPAEPTEKTPGAITGYPVEEIYVDTTEDVEVVKNGLTLTEVLTYGTVGQVYGRRIDGVLQNSTHHITLYSCSMGEKIGFGMKEDVACSLEDIEASDWEFVGYNASTAAAKLAE